MASSPQPSQELEILVEITEILTGSLPFLEKCESVLAVLARFTRSDFVTLREFDSETSTLNLVASHVSQPKSESVQIPISINSAMLAQAIEKNAAVVVNDYESFESHDHGYREWGMASALLVPVLVDGDIFGAMGFGSNHLDHYDQEMVKVVSTISAVVGMMMAKADLQESYEVEANIGRIVSAPLVGSDVFEQFGAEAARIIDFDRFVLNSVEAQGETFVTEFLFGEAGGGYPVREVVSTQGTAQATVIRSRKAQRGALDDEDQGALLYPRSGHFVESGQRYFLGVPLIVGDQLIGTIGFNRGEVPFSQKNLARAERLANLVAGAFADFKQQEYRVQAELEINESRSILQAEAAIGRIISAPLIDADVFEKFAEEASKVIEFEGLALNSVNIQDNTYITEFLFGLDLPGYSVGSILDTHSTGLERVMRTRSVQRFDFETSVGSEPSFRLAGPFLAAGQQYVAGVPLIVGDQVIGTLGFIRGGEPYTEVDALKAERLGNLVAGAFADFKQQEFRVQAEREISKNRTILEAEANIGRVLSSPMARAEGNETLKTEISRIIAADRILITSIDIKNEKFSQDFDDFLDHTELRLANSIGKSYAGTMTEEVVRTGKGQLLHHDDPLLESGHYALTKIAFSRGPQSIMVVPLRFEEEIIGVLGLFNSEAKYLDEELATADRIANILAGALANFKIANERDRAQSAREESERLNRIILEAEANIGRILSSPLGFPGSSEALRLELAKIIPLDRYVILSVNPETQTFSQDFSEFVYGPSLIVANNPEQSYAGSMTEEIIRTGVGQIIHADDSRLSSGKIPIVQLVFDLGYRSMMGVPLEFEGRVIGVFACSRRAGEYEEDDIRTAYRIANLLAGALATVKVATERNRAQNALTESEGRFQQIANSIAGVFWLIEFEPNRLVYASHNFEEVWGIPVASVYEEIGNWSQTVYPEDLTRFIELREEAYRTGELEIEYRIVHPDGMARWILTKGFPVWDERGELLGMSGITEDITDRKIELERIAEAGRIFEQARLRAEESRSESEALLGQIADSIGGVFWLVDLDPHRLVYASPRAEEVWDLPLSEIYGDFTRIFNNIHPEDRENIRNGSATSDKTGYLDIEYRITKRDGEVRWIRSRGFPVRNDRGEISRMSGFAEDITDRKSELERITEAGRLLSVGESASGVAHDINNPLAAINLYSEALMDQRLPDDVIDDLKVISAQGKRAGAIVRNLLQFARKSSPEVTLVDAKEFIDHCVSLKSHDFRVNNVSATTSVLLDTPRIAIDEQLMTQVILNLLSNAEQACVRAHGRGHISISVQGTQNTILIAISDDGPGIPEEIQSKVFDPFFTTKEVGSGTGLGLSVSYGIIAQLGGSLSVESDGQNGATFHIEIPNVRTKESPEFTQPSASDNAALTTRRILVVDDEPDIRNVLQRVLVRRDFVVDQASDGEAAWAKLQDSEYDCILLDMRMAGVDGKEFFERLRSSSPETAPKVIFLTGDLANDSTREFLRPLVNIALSKPISVEELEEALSLKFGT